MLLSRFAQIKEQIKTCRPRQEKTKRPVKKEDAKIANK